MSWKWGLPPAPPHSLASKYQDSQTPKRWQWVIPLHSTESPCGLLFIKWYQKSPLAGDRRAVSVLRLMWIVQRSCSLLFGADGCCFSACHWSTLKSTRYVCWEHWPTREAQSWHPSWETPIGPLGALWWVHHGEVLKSNLKCMVYGSAQCAACFWSWLCRQVSSSHMRLAGQVVSRTKIMEHTPPLPSSHEPWRVKKRACGICDSATEAKC